MNSSSRDRIIEKDLVIPALDGYPLAATSYCRTEPASEQTMIVLSSATGVRRTFYTAFARFLAAHDFGVITFDYRGIGGSRPATLNKFKAFMRDWGEKDIAGIIEWTRSKHPGNKICAIGHSVGGQVVGLARNNDQIAAMILVASQSGHWRLWPPGQRYFVWFFWYGFLPLLTALLAFFPAKALGMGENLPAGVAFEWASWGRRRRYILDDKQLKTLQNFRQFRAPILSFSIDKDFFAPAQAVDELMTFYPLARTERRHLTAASLGVEQFGHFDFFREHFDLSLWTTCVQWLKQAL